MKIKINLYIWFRVGILDTDFCNKFNLKNKCASAHLHIFINFVINIMFNYRENNQDQKDRPQIILQFCFTIINGLMHKCTFYTFNYIDTYM